MPISVRPDGQPWPDHNLYPPTEPVYQALRAAQNETTPEGFFKKYKLLTAGREPCWPWKHERPPLFLRYWSYVGRPRWWRFGRSRGGAYCLRCGQRVEFLLTREEGDRMIREYYGV